MILGVAEGLWLRLGSVFTQRYLEIFGDIWIYLEIFGDIWKYLEIFGDIWKYLVIFGVAAGLWLRLGSVFTQRSSCVAAARS